MDITEDPGSNDHVPYPTSWEIIQTPINPFADIVATMKRMLWASAFPVYFAVLIFSCALMLATLPGVLSWMSSLGEPLPIYIAITPWPIGLPVGGVVIQAWFVFVVAVVFVSIAIAGYGMVCSYKGRSVLTRVFMPVEGTSGVETTAKLFMASTFFLMIYYFLLSMFGTEPTTPDFASQPLEGLIFGLVNAAVNEEIISRLLLIGIPLLAIAQLKRHVLPIRKYFLGGGLTINRVTIVLIVFSSLMFALAHMVGSWDLYKVPPTFISGLALGYLFVTKGLFTSIIFHFSTNFMFIAPEIWPDSVVVSGVLMLVWLLWASAGAYFFLHYSAEVFVKVPRIFRSKGSLDVDQELDGDQDVEAHTERRQTGFICSRCGCPHAKYENHKLICLNCDNEDQP